MARRKVLQVVEDLNVGGLERVVECIASQLNRDRFDVSVWCLARGGAIADELKRKGIPVEILDLHSYHNPLSVLRLARRMRREGFHLVHTHGYFAGTFGRLAAAIAGVPAVIHHVHTTCSNLKPRHHRIERILSLRTGRIVCVAGAVRESLSTALSIQSSKTCVIYNGSSCRPETCSEAQVDSVRSAMGIRPGDRVITEVASLSDNKGQAVLLEAFHRVAAAHERSWLVLVGDGHCRHRLEERARACGLASRVVFTGLLKDVRPVLRLTDVLVLPTTQREGLSVSLIEGAAAGLPLVGSRLGAIPEVVEDGVNGILVQPRDAEDLRRALDTLLCNPELRKRMGEAGRAMYECKFSLDRMMGQLQALYEEEIARAYHAA